MKIGCPQDPSVGDIANSSLGPSKVIKKREILCEFQEATVKVRECEIGVFLLIDRGMGKFWNSSPAQCIRPLLFTWRNETYSSLSRSCSCVFTKDGSCVVQ